MLSGLEDKCDMLLIHTLDSVGNYNVSGFSVLVLLFTLKYLILEVSVLGNFNKSCQDQVKKMFVYSYAG